MFSIRFHNFIGCFSFASRLSLFLKNWVQASRKCKLSGKDRVKKQVDFVSNCVVDLVSSGVLKHYTHPQFSVNKVIFKFDLRNKLTYNIFTVDVIQLV